MIRTHLGPDNQAKVFSKYVWISPRYLITKFEKFDYVVCMTPQSQNFRLANQKNVLLMVSFMIDMFTPKKISPDCPLKSNQKLTKISILTLQCDAHRGAWLHSGKHTVELDSAVGCTLRSFLRNFDYLTQRSDAPCGAWLRSGMHTTESD